MKLLLAYLALTICLIPSLSVASGSRPFWTEKSSFVEGDTVYAVGIASSCETIEKARQLAFENAKIELLNFAQITELKEIKIETQMTYDEVINEKITVYRLIKTDIDSLNKLKINISKTTQEKYKNYIDTQSKEIDKQQLLLSDIKQNEQKLNEINEEYNRISNNIKNISENVKNYIKNGMTRGEVVKLMGDPRGKTSWGSYNYGNYWVIFDYDIVKCVSSNTVDCSYYSTK